MGLQLGWGVSDMEEGGWDRHFLFFSCVLWGEFEGATPCCQATPTPGDGGQWFDDALETLSVPTVLLEWFG